MLDLEFILKNPDLTASLMKRRKALGFNQDNFIEEKTYSVGFYFDFIVPVCMTRVKGVYHKNYYVEHFIAFIFNKKFFTRILKDLKLF